MGTKTANRKEVIILLLAEMRNYRMILGLRSAGLHTYHFYTDLSDLILDKVGFETPQHESLHDWYEEVLCKTVNQDLRYYIFHERELAAQMYDQLLHKKQLMTPPPQSLRVRYCKRFKKMMDWL